MKNKCTILILFLFYLSALQVYAQYLQNESLEGETGNDLGPYEYEFCGSDLSWSNPNVYDQSIPVNSADILYPVVPGSDFILLRARGLHYNGPWAGFEPLQREYMYTRLIQPVIQNNCYVFEAYLAYTRDYPITDSLEPDISYPLVLKIWGTNDPCTELTELLVETELIENQQWGDRKKYYFTPSQTYNYLYFEVDWDLSLKAEPYNGIMMLDEFDLNLVGTSDIIGEYDVYFKGDNLTTLTSTAGTSYKWAPSEYLTGPDVQTTRLISYFPEFSVAIGSGNDCPDIENFNVILDCDTMNRYRDTIHDFYYNPNKVNVLRASPGVSWDWEPKTNLSAYNISSPVITAYDENFFVTVEDKYACSYTEQFNILVNCDMIYPDKRLLIKDTLIESLTTIELVPKYGEVDNWTPDIFLSCNTCQNPNTTPLSPIVYEANLTDVVGCTHTEIFSIDVILVVPNAITPNGDGINDAFEIMGLPDGSSIIIYDKNGNLLFSADPYNSINWWRGTDNKHKLLESGNYWYTLKIPGRTEVIKGFIFLKR